ncbi:DUF4157 domain-containing protein [uncultured Microscilla sp.]|uniref:eCIS core domain-containing protein n=1 Tax=uncultured Microscilla sp. TaxID=432653 RepID=UPI00260E89FE|nr:DUF4157 domain-containing protein [uncultured Microscilla sp.]
MSKLQQSNEADQNQQQTQNQPTVQKKELPEVVQNKAASAIKSSQSDLPPIQSKQAPVQAKQVPIQAKQRPIQRNTGSSKSSGNVNEAQVKANVSNIMGVDVTQAKVNYNSGKPAQLKAEAYAQGNTVEIAPGKEKHLGHELAHIGQQAQGRVQPTIQGNNGIGINNDPKLEKEADDIGDKAMSMQPTQLKQGGNMKSSLGNTQQGAPVQGKFGKLLASISKMQLQEEIARYYHPAPFLRKLDELEEDQTVYRNVHDIGRALGLKPTGYSEKHSIVKQDLKLPHYATRSESERMIIEMQKLQNQKDDMKWMGSQATSFKDWLNNPEKDAPLPDSANCWNAVLLAAFNAGLVDKSYIKKANQQAVQKSSDPIPKLARQIYRDHRGSIKVNKKLKPTKNSKINKQQQQKDWLNRVRRQYQNIPRGDVIVIGKNGTHVCLSLGGGQIIELDARDIVQVKNPKYDKNYDKNEKQFQAKINSLEGDIKSLNMRINKLDSKDPKYTTLTEQLKTKTQQLEQQVSDYKTFKETKSKQEYLTNERPRNEIRTLDMLVRKYFDEGQYINLDGIYWSPLPLDIII